MTPILIDTNLLIYLYDQNSPVKQDKSMVVLSQLESMGTGRLSVLNLAEFFCVSTKKLTPPLSSEEALDQVNLFTRAWPVFDLTTLIVLEAARGVRDYQISFFDAQIWATARLNQVPIIFSEDFNVGSMLEGVQFVNPYAPEFRLDAWV
ncbi:unnamed protein product [marine sediment metagenome]|uniref:PIN domain-containing protein n=1 Tax=marine sediment metagenome TaxID=412755 RepID=X1CIG1_9ZZZZ